MQNPEVLRMGVVGCGGHGSALAEAITRARSMCLTACADPDQVAASRAAAFAAGVSTHTSIEALLAESEVDAIIIAAPHHLLAPIALTALRAGKHVMAEKPIAVNERGAAEIETVARQVGVCYMAGYSFRFSMGRCVEDLLAAGAVGEILAISCSIGTPPLDTGWIANPETGGGPLLFVGCHMVDLILWFAGDTPAMVYADVMRRSDTGADKTSAFQIRFARGLVAQCLVLQGASTFWYDLHVYGADGEISLRGRNFLQFEVEVCSKVLAAYREPSVIHPLVRRDNITMMLVPELEEFANAIHERRPPAITATDGRKVLRVLDAVAESGKSGQPVVLSR